MRMQKLPKSTFLKAFQQLFYFPSVKDGLLSYSIRFYPRKDDLSRGLDRLPFSSGKQPFPRASSGRLFSFHCKKTDAPPAETAAGRHICFVAMKDTKPMKTEWPIITGSDNARRDSAAPDT